MSAGTVHSLSPALAVIEGHHPHSLFGDPDLPTVAVYRSGPRLYLLDTGVGPDQRAGIRSVVEPYQGELEELLLLNSHGHIDHLGNNDLAAELAGPDVPVRHFLSRDARSALDVATFFGAMYKRGLGYFDYLAGLRVPAAVVAPLLRALGAPDDLTEAQVAELGSRLSELGVLPAISGFLPSVVVDTLLQTYPPTFPSIETITDYEDLGPAAAIGLGPTTWTGWTFAGADGEPDVQVLQSAGHSAGGVVFYLPRERFLMLADETTSVPIWADSVPDHALHTARRGLALMDAGLVDRIAAGHQPLLPVGDDEARRTLRGVIDSGESFRRTVDDAIGAHRDGVSIDELYDELVRAAEPDSVIALLVRLQFPVFGTFLKLTLLNHCLLSGHREGRDVSGRPTFRLG